jgi:hypothetical protein
LTEKQDKIAVQIKYKDIEKEFCAPIEDIWLLLNKFFNEFLPSFEIATKLWLSVDLQQLAKDCEGLIAFSKEGPNLMVPSTKLTDNETLLMWLLAKHLGQKLGILATDEVTKEELRLKLGKSAKITSTRLGELAKTDSIMKTDSEKFRITTFGVVQMQKEILPKIQSKKS